MVIQLRALAVLVEDSALVPMFGSQPNMAAHNYYNTGSRGSGDF